MPRGDPTRPPLERTKQLSETEALRRSLRPQRPQYRLGDPWPTVGHLRGQYDVALAFVAAKEALVEIIERLLREGDSLRQ